MEGYLRKYRNFVSGYMKCYVRLKSSTLIIQKDKKDRDQRQKISLIGLSIESNQKDNSEFILINDQHKKPQKLFLKATDQKERDQWIQAIEEAIAQIEHDAETLSHDSSLQPFKENLYEAFSSRLFVDECDLDTKLQAYNDVEKMCKAEIEILHDMVKSTIEEDKATQLIRKIISIRNLCKTLGDLIKNIVGEIDKSREQMFKILESIAVLEINKDAKKFNLEKIKHSKLSEIQQKSEVERRRSTDSSTKINSSSSKTKKNSQSVSSYSSGGQVDQKQLTDMDFQEEEKHSDSSFDQFKGRTSSIGEETEFEFDIEDEEDIFLDAQEEIIEHKEQLVKCQKIFIQDVFEERLSLPHLRPLTMKISFWQVFKDLVGKDLTRISMPVYFNEPLSLTQKMAETVEYNELLEKAALEPNSLIRLAYITSYIASRYFSVIGHMNKPFNSLLGETFELVTTKYRFISEQVSHHPPITAYHCESDQYVVFAQARTTMKFNGRYISFAPKDRVYITLKLEDGSQEFYSCTLPQTTVHNLVIGKLYIDVHGKSQIINHTSQESCDLDWKERGWTGKNANMLVGTIKSASGKTHYKVQGRFTEGLNLINLESNEETEIFKVKEKIENSELMYGFSAFTLQLNYLPETLKEKLPHTDSRFRPDQRALEQGSFELAIKEKHRLEEAQRTRKKQAEEQGLKPAPVYFEEKVVEATNEKVFKFNGKYWEDRSNKDWSKLPPIFQ